MLNICYFISDVNKSFTLEWMFKYLDRSKLTITCVIIHDSKTDLERYLETLNIKVLRLRGGKKRVAANVVRSMLFLKRNKAQAVHCHLFEGSLIGLTAAWLMRIKLRIHTRHNATIHHDYHPQAVKYDRFINFLSSRIISISDQVTKILTELEQVDQKKIIKIHHGFDFAQMSQMASEHFSEVKRKYNFSETNFYIGVISRYMHFKGLQYVIPAFEKILEKIPNARLILANAYGPYGSHIKNLLAPLPKESYTEIHFEQNVYSLLLNFNVFIHTPIDTNAEAFGQVYIENMALGIPCIVTKSGIANEIIENGVNALTVPFKNADKIEEAILRLHNDKALCESLVVNARRTLEESFNIGLMIRKLEDAYGI